MFQSLPLLKLLAMGRAKWCCSLCFSFSVSWCLSFCFVLSGPGEWFGWSWCGFRLSNLSSGPTTTSINAQKATIRTTQTTPEPLNTRHIQRETLLARPLVAGTCSVQNKFSEHADTLENHVASTHVGWEVALCMNIYMYGKTSDNHRKTYKTVTTYRKLDERM